MNVAIVILNWNGSKMMRQYLPTVMKYSRSDAEIWVADNASSDDSMQMLERDFPQVKRLQLDKNYGLRKDTTAPCDRSRPTITCCSTPTWR